MRTAHYLEGFTCSSSYPAIFASSSGHADHDDSKPHTNCCRPCRRQSVWAATTAATASIMARIPMSLLLLMLVCSVASAESGGRIGHLEEKTAHEAPSIDMGQLDIRLNIYVYDNPALENTEVIECYRDRKGVSPWQDERHDTAQDMGEVWMHRALLEHPWRVNDPREADLFHIPLYPVLSYQLLGEHKKCNGRTHKERMREAIDFLEVKSPYFNRYGGADHFLVCAWWKCQHALDRVVRMRLARTIIGINEALSGWANWGCKGRMVVIPYTPNSVTTAVERIGGLPPEERIIPFFFAGTARHRPERENLEVVRNLYPNSTIEIGSNANKWGEDAVVYADHITRSRYCFCPRGDSRSSRRIFDAIAGGCIPVLTEDEEKALPFVKSGLDYSKFAIVAPSGSFSSREKVSALAQDLASRTDRELEPMRLALRRATGSIVYGTTVGPEVTDMRPYRNVADRFMQEVWTTVVGSEGGSISDGNVWSCPPVNLSERDLAPRTWFEFPLPRQTRRQWLCDSETIVNDEKKLLFCAIPNTGSMQFRMLAKRMQGVEHWAVYDDREKLFDPVTSGLNLLDTSKDSLLSEIYAETGSGWVKIVVVRDPVTRLLSAYLDLVRMQKENNSDYLDEDLHDRRTRRRLQRGRTSDSDQSDSNEDGSRHELHDSAAQSGEGVENPVVVSLSSLGPAEDTEDVLELQRRRGLSLEGIMKDLGRAHQDEKHVDGEWPPDAEEELSLRGSIFFEGGDPVSFADFLDRLGVEMPKAGAAFRPQASLCGLKHASFDSVIPFETLKKTSIEVVRSLPGSVWERYASSGFGPDGESEFMAYDYGGADSWLSPDSRDESLPIRAEDLLNGSSCGWTRFYTDESMLDKVSEVYALDYEHFAWYGVDAWKRRLMDCLEG